MSAAPGTFHEEEDDARTPGGDRRMLRRLMVYLRPYRARIALAVVLLLCVSALGIAGPYLVKLTIDRALESDQPVDTRVGLLAQIAGVYVAVLVATAIFHYLQILVLQTTGQRVMLDLRMQLFRHLMRQDMERFDRRPVGTSMTRLTSDVEALNELFTSGVVTVAMDTFTLLSIMVVMVNMDWRLALMSFAVIPLLFALSLFFRTRVRKAFRRIRIRVSRINGFLQEHLAGIRVVQAFDQGPRRLRRFDDLNEAHTQAHLETVAAFAVFFPAVEILSTAAVVLLLWQGGSMVLAGAVSLGTLVAFVQYAQRFYRPISDLSEKFNILQGAMAASERIFDLLDETNTIHAPAVPRRPETIQGAIRFDQVHFRYRTTDEDGQVVDSSPVLDGLSFQVEPGQRIAIVGSTGAGKTTVISLLTRFYDVREGSIEVDGIDVRHWDPRELRRHIGVVLQDPRLFSGTLEENLSLWREDLPRERWEQAIERIGLGKVIERLPRGLQEEMREGGSRLSTGERQLVGFARALAHDPPILVLDEATASVDAETEVRIQEATEELLRGRTSLVIAHRLSTVRNADRILVLHKGRLHEQGTHDELIALGGLYRRLVELQLTQPGAAG